MPLGRKARMALGLVGGVGLVIAALLIVLMAPPGEPERAVVAERPSDPAPVPPSEPSTEPGPTARAARLAVGDRDALDEAIAALVPAEPGDGEGVEPPVEPMTGEQLDAWLGDLAGMNAGFLRFAEEARVEVVASTVAALGRLAAEPTPPRWPEALGPTAALLTKALADPSPAVRAEAAERLGGLWSWSPRPDPTPEQQRAIAAWKDRMHGPLVALLGDEQPGIRLAAVIALGKLPVAPLAAPAVDRLDDDEPAVRVRVLTSFAHRPDLLTNEAVVRRLFDPTPAVALASRIVLRARGLEDEQIGLAQLLYHPRAELRASAVAMLEGRDDIDPTVWLVTLSRDEDPAVRSRALEALVRLGSPDARHRLGEMAASDPSEALREAARRSLEAMTPELPPLPDAAVIRAGAP